MKRFIVENIARCERQLHIDNVLTGASGAATTTLLVFSFGYQDLLLPLLIVGWLVHLLVLFYCNRLWTARKRRWEALFRWIDLLETVPDFMASTGGLVSPLLRLGSR